MPKKKGAVFTDRDGVMNEGINVTGPQDFRLIEGVAGALAKVKKASRKYGIITNQGGLGEDVDGSIRWPGHPLTREALTAIHARMLELLGPSAQPDVIKICPHPSTVRCKCRKPKPLMLLEAAEELGVDITRSYMIGDRLSDVQCGINAGATGILVLSGPESHKEALLVPEGTLILPSLVEAVDWILEHID